MQRTRTQSSVTTRPILGRALSALLSLLLPASLAAAELGGEDGIEVHGFASQGFILTLKNDYLADNTTEGSFEFSEIGLNFTKDLTDTLRTGVQLFAHDLGPTGDFDPTVDWFYIDYRPFDWLGLRAGRLKIPFGFHNEIQDVDSARLPVLLPQSVYPLQTRQILFAQNGAELYGFARMGDAGAVDYRAYYGTIFLNARELTPPGASFELAFRVPYVFGGRLIWETPLEGLRLGGSFEKVRLDTTVFAPGIPSFGIVSRSRQWLVGLEYAIADLMLTAEYARSRSEQSSDAPELSPPIESTSENAYAMASYRLASWFQTGAYYAISYPDVDQREGRQNYQHDLAVTFRYDVNEYWLVKLEGHYMSGTAGLLNPLRINPPDITQAAQHWAAYFVKTTAHF